MNALKPIKIGPFEVASPVILAPMTAVTDLPFRRADIAWPGPRTRFPFAM